MSTGSELTTPVGQPVEVPKHEGERLGLPIDRFADHLDRYRQVARSREERDRQAAVRVAGSPDGRPSNAEIGVQIAGSMIGRVIAAGSGSVVVDVVVLVVVDSGSEVVTGS